MPLNYTASFIHVKKPGVHSDEKCDHFSCHVKCNVATVKLVGRGGNVKGKVYFQPFFQAISRPTFPSSPFENVKFTQRDIQV